MKPIQFLGILILSAVLSFACSGAERVRTAEEKADGDWFFEWLADYGGTDHWTMELDRLKTELQRPVNYERLLRIAHRRKDEYFDRRNESRLVPITIRLLGFVQRDEAVEAIAPYLKQPDLLTTAIDSLRMTENPKAVPYLVAALKEFEKRVVSESDRSQLHSILINFFQALATIRTAEGLAALDACLTRLEKFRGDKIGEETWNYLIHMRNTGDLRTPFEIQKAAQATAQPSTSPVATPPLPPSPSAAVQATPASNATPDQISKSSASAGQVPPIEHRAPTWLWIGGFGVLFVLAVLFFKHRA